MSIHPACYTDYSLVILTPAIDFVSRFPYRLRLPFGGFIGARGCVDFITEKRNSPVMTADDDRVYYVISDLHIGGDEQLEEVEFLDELLGFLRQLEDT